MDLSKQKTFSDADLYKGTFQGNKPIQFADNRPLDNMPAKKAPAPEKTDPSLSGGTAPRAIGNASAYAAGGVNDVNYGVAPTKAEKAAADVAKKEASEKQAREEKVQRDYMTSQGVPKAEQDRQIDASRKAAGLPTVAEQMKKPVLMADLRRAIDGEAVKRSVPQDISPSLLQNAIAKIGTPLGEIGSPGTMARVLTQSGSMVGWSSLKIPAASAGLDLSKMAFGMTVSGLTVTVNPGSVQFGRAAVMQVAGAPFNITSETYIFVKYAYGSTTAALDSSGTEPACDSAWYREWLYHFTTTTSGGSTSIADYVIGHLGNIKINDVYGQGY